MGTAADRPIVGPGSSKASTNVRPGGSVISSFSGAPGIPTALWSHNGGTSAGGPTGAALGGPHSTNYGGTNGATGAPVTGVMVPGLSGLLLGGAVPVARGCTRVTSKVRWDVPHQGKILSVSFYVAGCVHLGLGQSRRDSFFGHTRQVTRFGKDGGGRAITKAVRFIQRASWFGPDERGTTSTHH